MAQLEFDIIIVGAGPGGYIGAIRASQLGFTTALVEAQHLGGVCLNWGCIPTKALLRSADVYRQIQEAELYGLSAPQLDFNIEKIVARSRTVARQLSSGVSHLLKKNNVHVFDGFGTLLGNGKLTVDKKGQEPVLLKGKHILLATGSRSKIIPGLEPDGNLVWTSKEALVPKERLKSLLVIGAGAIGIEFASFYNTFGTKVTVVELMDQILPAEDKEIADFARNQLEKQGIQFHLKAKVTKLQRHSDAVTVTVEKKAETSCFIVDKVIVAVGVTPNVENIGLDNAGVALDERGFVKTDDLCRTSADGVYAIGDVAGPPCLAHKASHEAILCVEQIAGLPGFHLLNKTLIPSCTYGHPQVASVGLTEARAKEAGFELKVGRFPVRANGKAIALGESEGLVKTIFDSRTGELLGAHLVGPEVTEMIQGFTIARTLETTEADLMQVIFPHPTLSEMMHESVLNAYSRAIHI
jgi:dihydrolipoamide dehydrogenase